jgi:hypothetical protein
VATADPNLTGTPATPTAEPEPEAEAGLWCTPFNVSKSGAASRPALAAEQDGTLHAMWWDEFDGTKVSFFTPEDGWSEAESVTPILGGRIVQDGRSVRLPYSDLRLIASPTGWIYAFWVDTNNNLRYARSRSQTGSFALGPSLALNPLTWDVSIDAAGDLHLAYIRTDNTQALPAGVYYRTSNSDGAAWRTATLLTESLYFRALAREEAFVRVAGDGQGLVIATWDDAELRRSYYTISTNEGLNFRDPLPVEQIDQEAARRTRLMPVGGAGGGFLRFWEAGDGCAIYQQQSGDLSLAGQLGAFVPPTSTPDPLITPDPLATPTVPGPTSAWTDPVRVFDTLNGCLSGVAFYDLPDGRNLAVLYLNNARPVLATWSGERWTAPVGLQISFVEATANRPVTLDCLGVTLTNNQMAVTGCDQFGDVWVTASALGLPELLPALTTAWSAPSILSPVTGESELPAAATSADGQLFVLWSEAAAAGQPGTALMHTSGDGVTWPAPVPVIEAQLGKITTPRLAVGPGNLLHLVWSGGFTGQTFYSHAFVRDARVPSGWSAPVRLPAPSEVGGWPDLAVDAAGTLHAVYSVALNEGRGVYYTRSVDQGNTWSDFVQVFDGAAADWAMVRNSRLAIDSTGGLHLVWVRAALPDVGTPLGVFYSRSTDGGQTWAAPQEISGLNSDNPRVIVSAPGVVHLAWTRPVSSGLEIVHRWSPDNGQTWSPSVPLAGVRRVSATDFSLTTDGAGAVFLTGIERSTQNAAALFYLRWDGQTWVDREVVPLGYDPAPASGASAVLLPNGTLAVFYRVRAPYEGGGARYIIGYISRPVGLGAPVLAPTFTPSPVVAQGPGLGAGATLTPLPTPDLTNVTPPAVDSTVRTQIAVALAAIVLISGFAIFRLWRGRR